MFHNFWLVFIFFIFFSFKLYLSIPKMSYTSYAIKWCQIWGFCWRSWFLFRHVCRSWSSKIWRICWYAEKWIPKPSDEYGRTVTSSYMDYWRISSISDLQEMSRVPGIVASSNILANEFASNKTENQSRFVYEFIAYAWRLKQFEDSIFFVFNFGRFSSHLVS